MTSPFDAGQTVLYDSGSYAGVGQPLPPLEAKVLKITPQRVQIEFYDPGYKATVRRFVRPDKLMQLDGDDFSTVNGLESELVALRHQYAEQSDELATVQTERDALMAVMVGLHNMLNEAGLEQEGDLTVRVKTALERLQKAEREMDDLSHDVGVFIYAGTYVDKDDAEALRSPETVELYNILRDAHQRQVILEMETKHVPVWAALWKRAAKRWYENYHALDIQHAHREQERANWKAAAKRFRRRWRDACAELANVPHLSPWAEPLLHTHIEDGLPDFHPLAFEQVHCKSCRQLVHAANNECMQTWVETGQGAMCLRCFRTANGYDGAVIEDKWALSGIFITYPEVVEDGMDVLAAILSDDDEGGEP